jgi:hypothetical protein
MAGEDRLEVVHHSLIPRREQGSRRKQRSMNLRITITIQLGDLPETPVFEADVVSPETVYSTLTIAEQTARATVAAMYPDQVCIREYLGPTLIATLHSKAEHNKRRVGLAPVQFVQIRNKYSGKVLDISELSTSNGTVIQQWEYLNGRSQQWQLTLTDGEYYKITNRLSGKVVEVSVAAPYAVTTLQQWDYCGGKNQEWRLVPIDTGYFTFVNKLSGKVLEVSDFSRSNGALVRQQDYLGSDNQKWQITRVVGGVEEAPSDELAANLRSRDSNGQRVLESYPERRVWPARIFRHFVHGASGSGAHS